MINLNRMSQRLRRIRVLVICFCLLNLFFCSYARDANESLAAGKCLKYHNISPIGFAESTLYQELYYEIKVPQGLIGYGNSAKGIFFLYPDSQVICAFTETVWVNADTDRTDPTGMVFNYKGYAFNLWVFQNLDYFFDYYRDVPETPHPHDYNNNWYWDDDNAFEDATELYSVYINDFIWKYAADGHEDYLKPLPGRRHRYFNKDGVRVVLYNILPENLEYFYSLTHSSLHVPCKEEFQRISEDSTNSSIFTICDCYE